MTTIAEIESAIERLSASQVEELAKWLADYRAQKNGKPPADAWLERARGAALPSVTTASVMELTRGEK